MVGWRPGCLVILNDLVPGKKEPFLRPFGILRLTSLQSLKQTVSHLKIGQPKKKLRFEPSIFRCYLSFRECKSKSGGDLICSFFLISSAMGGVPRHVSFCAMIGFSQSLCEKEFKMGYRIPILYHWSQTSTIPDMSHLQVTKNLTLGWGSFKQLPISFNYVQKGGNGVALELRLFVLVEASHPPTLHEGLLELGVVHIPEQYPDVTQIFQSWSAGISRWG